MNLILPALTLGFLGSFHCIGMCGPIALSLPFSNSGSFHKISGILLYNFGRALTYSALGFVFGSFGQMVDLFGFQQYLSITLGVLILLFVFFSSPILSKFPVTSSINKFMSSLKSKLSGLLIKKGLSSIFSIGLLNGLLPCGLVYMGIAGSIASTNAVNGALFMFFFGMGTIPVMLSVSLFGNIISLKFKQTIQGLVPYVLSLMAILLILRGLNLGIPYLSPEKKLNQIDSSKTDIMCHK